jgi:localization factor PodJL
MSDTALDDLTDRLDRLQLALDKPQQIGSGPPLHELTERLDRMNAALSAPQTLASHAALDALAKRLDRVQETLGAPQPLVATASLEAMISLLAERLEKAQHPDADDSAFEALERQISRIAEKLEGQTSRSSDLSGIERTLGELLANLEQTRNAAIDAADDAALRAVRETMAQLPARGGGGEKLLPEEMRQHLAELREIQDTTGRKTQTTLEAVNATLERLAERMNTLEGLPAIRPAPAATSYTPPPPAEAPKPRVAAAQPTPASVARAEADIGLRAPPTTARDSVDTEMSMDLPLEPGSGGPSGPHVRSALDASPVKASMAAPTGNDPRSVFIAAARRAAQAAAAEAATPTAKAGDVRTEIQPAAPNRDRAPQDRGPKPKFDARSSALPAQGSSLLQRNKRSILFGMAAVTLALGSIACWTALSGENALLGLAPTPVTATGTPAVPKSDAPAPAAPALAPPATTPTAPASKPQASLFSPEPETTASITPPGGATRSIGLPTLGGGIPSLTDAMAQTTAQATEEAAAVAARPALPEKLEAALKAGDPRATYDTAARLITPDSPPADLKAAAQLYQLAAAKGFAPAQYRLGSMYEKGIGVDKDIAMAKTWYERAAAKGNVKAMHNMAVLYAEGAIGGKPDYATAGQWFRQAAEHGLRDSQFNLAILVTRGLGATANLAEGYKWLSLAAAQGDTDAGKKRDEIGQRLEAATREKMDLAVQNFEPQIEPIMANEATLPAMAWTDNQPKGA